MRRQAGRHLTFDTVQDLGKRIVSGVFAADNKVPTEAKLSEEYGVSRTVTREAVKILTGKGLLTARPGRGTAVTPEDQWNLLDPDVLHWLLSREVSLDLLIEFTQARLGFEPRAAYLAAASATAEQKDIIADAIKEMERAKRGEADPLHSDINFHIASLNASNNRFLIKLDGLIETALNFSIRVSNRLKGVRTASVADHKKVADAIFAGDSEAAYAAMTSMLVETQRLYEDQREQSSQ